MCVFLLSQSCSKEMEVTKSFFAVSSLYSFSENFLVFSVMLFYCFNSLLCVVLLTCRVSSNICLKKFSVE